MSSANSLPILSLSRFKPQPPLPKNALPFIRIVRTLLFHLPASLSSLRFLTTTISSTTSQAPTLTFIPHSLKTCHIPYYHEISACCFVFFIPAFRLPYVQTSFSAPQSPLLSLSPYLFTIQSPFSPFLSSSSTLSRQLPKYVNIKIFFSLLTAFPLHHNICNRTERCVVGTHLSLGLRLIIPSASLNQVPMLFAKTARRRLTSNISNCLSDFKSAFPIEQFQARELTTPAKGKAWKLLLSKLRRREFAYQSDRLWDFFGLRKPRCYAMLEDRDTSRHADNIDQSELPDLYRKRKDSPIPLFDAHTLLLRYSLLCRRVPILACQVR